MQENIISSNEIIELLERALQAYHWQCVSEAVAGKEADKALEALKKYRNSHTCTNGAGYEVVKEK